MDFFNKWKYLIKDSGKWELRDIGFWLYFESNLDVEI